MLIWVGEKLLAVFAGVFPIKGVNMTLLVGLCAQLKRKGNVSTFEVKILREGNISNASKIRKSLKRWRAAHIQVGLEKKGIIIISRVSIRQTCINTENLKQLKRCKH